MEKEEEKKETERGSKPELDGIRKSREAVLASIGEKLEKYSAPSEVKTAIKKEKRPVDGISAERRPVLELKAQNDAGTEAAKPRRVQIPAPEKPLLARDISAPKVIKETSGAPETSIVIPKPVPAKKARKARTPKQNKTPKVLEKKKNEEAVLVKKKSSISLRARVADSIGIAMLIVSFFFFIYLLLVFLILNYGLRIPFLAFVSEKIFVPAFISADGIIAYDDFLELKKQNFLPDGDKESAKAKIANFFVMDRLEKRLGTSNEKEIRVRLARDTQANLAPYNRIKKIKSTIVEEGSFVKAAQKFGEAGKANINTSNLEAYEFGPSVGHLEADQTSDIITTPSGYYIVHCYAKEGDNLSLSYIFIPAITLEEYIDENTANYHFWSLARL